MGTLTLLSPPQRFYDSRGGLPFTNGRILQFYFRGSFPNARGIVGNLTVVSPSSTGNFQINTANSFPSDLPSIINLIPNQDLANGFTTALDSGGNLWVKCSINGGSVHLIIDVYGYYQ